MGEVEAWCEGDGVCSYRGEGDKMQIDPGTDLPAGLCKWASRYWIDLPVAGLLSSGTIL